MRSTNQFHMLSAGDTFAGNVTSLVRPMLTVAFFCLYGYIKIIYSQLIFLLLDTHTLEIPVKVGLIDSLMPRLWGGGDHLFLEWPYGIFGLAIEHLNVH